MSIFVIFLLKFNDTFKKIIDNYEHNCYDIPNIPNTKRIINYLGFIVGFKKQQTNKNLYILKEIWFDTHKNGCASLSCTCAGYIS